MIRDGRREEGKTLEDTSQVYSLYCIKIIYIAC